MDQNWKRGKKAAKPIRPTMWMVVLSAAAHDGPQIWALGPNNLIQNIMDYFGEKEKKNTEIMLFKITYLQRSKIIIS